MKRRVRSSWVAFAACALALAGCKDDTLPPAAAPGPGVPVAGAGAAAVRAQATIAPLAGNTITGTATFTQVGLDVDLMLTVQNCPAGDHPWHIHQGTACTDMTTQGAHWDGDGTPAAPTRGEGMPMLTCMANGTGTVTYKRASTAGPTQVWNIGGAPDANVVGHVIVIHLPDKMRIGCGPIVKL